MNVTLWMVRGPLAFAFIAVGTMKLFAYEKFKARSEKKGPTGITRGLAALIGRKTRVSGTIPILSLISLKKTAKRQSVSRTKAWCPGLNATVTVQTPGER